MGRVINRVTRVASSVAAAVAAAEGRGVSSSRDGGYGSDSDDGDASGEGLVGRSRGQGLVVGRQKLQLGALRPFGAIPAVRSAHPRVQGALARADRAWVRLLRLVSASPLSRVGLMGYLLLLHVLVLWVRMSCAHHHPAAAAAAGAGGALRAAGVAAPTVGGQAVLPGGGVAAGGGAAGA